MIVRLDDVGIGLRHDLNVSPQVALLQHNHLPVVSFGALAFAFDVAGVFVRLTATGLARLDLGVSTCNS